MFEFSYHEEHLTGNSYMFSWLQIDNDGADEVINPPDINREGYDL